MNKMNGQRNCQNGMVQIPEAMVVQMYSDIRELVAMHRKLIALYEEETELKKRHRAYLHVRDHADEVCRLDKKRIAEIHDHYEEDKQPEAAFPGVFGVLILPCSDEEDDSCFACQEEAGQDVDAFFRMLMGVLTEVNEKNKE